MDEYNKQKKIITLVGFASAGLCLLMICMTDRFRFLPEGMVIDETFLNTFKWMITAKYIFMFAGIIMIFVPYIVWQFKSGSKVLQNRILLMSIIAFTILTVLIGINTRSIVKGITKTPAVVQKTVTEKHKGGKRKGKRVNFDDGTFMHPSTYQYNLVREGDKVYVVYVGNTAIGVFRTDDYTLAVPESK